ncbi:MAG: hypothetical protein AB1468_03765 [Candidatus Micrarchaeota archaeon]
MKIKKGIFFTIDAILALLILFTVINAFAFLDVQMASPSITQQFLHLQAEDAIDVMAKLTVWDLRREPSIRELYSQGVLDELYENKTLLDMVGSLWATNTTENFSRAGGVVSQVMDPFIASRNWSFIVANDTLYNTTTYSAESAYISSISRRIASGFMKSAPSTGYAARAFIESIAGKNTAAYIFMGGFIGQGNLSFIMRDLPGDANVSEIFMELSAGDNFTLYVNGYACGNFTRSQVAFSVNNWSITDTACLSQLIKGGNNLFEIIFNGSDTGKHYFGGGYIQVIYSTDTFATAPSGNVAYYYFPGIVGAINLYDSFFIDGNITNMSVYLHYTSNVDTFLNLANATIWETYNETGSMYAQTITGDQILTALNASGLSFSAISNTTVPIRMGHQATNFTNGTGAVDVVLTTSVSQSMGTCDIRNGTSLSCSSSGNITRLTAAKAIDNIFIDWILNASGNRIAGFGYHQTISADDKYTLTSNATTAHAKTDSLNLRQSGRCYTCAIDEARKMLIPVSQGGTPPGSDYSKVRAILLMGDGQADTCVKELPEYQSNCGQTPAKKQAIEHACNVTLPPYSVGGNNLTIYTVGFGPSADNDTLEKIANCTGGKFYHSENYSELLEIYQDISEEIKHTVTYIAQSVYVSDANATLYNDSYVRFEYQPRVVSVGYREVEISVKSPQFGGCDGQVFIPWQENVTDVKVTSYSANYWTDLLLVNNSATSGWRTVYNLSVYNRDYIPLGDPYIVQFSSELIKTNETNYVRIGLGVNATNSSTSCATQDRMIYKALISASVPYSSVFPNRGGHNVSVYIDTDHDGVADRYVYVAIGAGLPGFDPTPVNVTELDPANNALDDALLRLLAQLNYVVIPPDNSALPGSIDNPIDLEITEQVRIDTSLAVSVPFLWGPTDMSVMVWA